MTSIQGSALLRKAWQGKWALVTGASAGIGEALAVELAAAGVNLALTARRQDRLEALAGRLGQEFGIQTRIIIWNSRMRRRRSSPRRKAPGWLSTFS
jgi:NADP-dependent 3-hydroxy acid dehydrogenase YdfG